MRPTHRLILAAIVLLAAVACRREETGSVDSDQSTPAVQTHDHAESGAQALVPPAGAASRGANAGAALADAVDDTAQRPAEREAIPLQPTNPAPQPQTVQPPTQLAPTNLEPRFRAAAERWTPPSDRSIWPRDIVSGRRLRSPQNAPVGMPDSVAQLLTGLLGDQIVAELIEPTALPLLRELLGELQFTDRVERYWWLDVPSGLDLQADVFQYDALVEMIAPQQDLQVSVYVLRDMVVDVAVTPYRSTNAVEDPTQ